MQGVLRLHNHELWQNCIIVTQHDAQTKGAARGGAEGAQATPLAIRILMFIS